MKLCRHTIRGTVKALILCCITLFGFLGFRTYQDGLAAMGTVSDTTDYGLEHNQVFAQNMFVGNQSVERLDHAEKTTIPKTFSVRASLGFSYDNMASTTTSSVLTPKLKDQVQDANQIKIRLLFDKWDGYKNVKMPKLFDPLNPPKEMNKSKKHWTDAVYFQKPVYPPKISYLMNNENLCGQEPIDVIIYVHSTPDHHSRRNHIRQTWGSVRLFKKVKIKVIFLIGVLQDKDEGLHDTLQYEQALYKDIVKGDFIDSYKNLTLKAIMGLQWISTFCSQARYVLKSDDDMIINIFAALRYLYVDRKDDKHFIACYAWPQNAMHVMRDPKSCLKWCVDGKELVGRDTYPRYCAGAGFMMTSDVARDLYNASQRHPFFWVDDAYLTGLLPRLVPDEINYFHFNDLLTMHGPTSEKAVLESPVVKIIVVTAGNEQRRVRFWRNMVGKKYPDLANFGIE